MRRTVVAFLAVAAFVSACQQPAETPEAEAAGATAPPPEMPADAPPQEEVDPALAVSPAGQPGSCLAEVGPDASARLVERCIAVSPATHPPCNAANPCEMYAPGEARPAECGA